MAGTKKLDLSAALENKPKTRKLLESLQQEASSMTSYASSLASSFQAVVDAQNAMCRATEGLAQQLDQYKEQSCAEDFVAESVVKLGESVQQLKTWQEMLATQMDQAMVRSVTDFINNDLLEMNRQRELFDLASQDHDSAMVKYSKTSKRRETDKARFEANAELYMARKKFHEVALQYYSAMNALQHKKKLAILNPLMNFMHAQLSYFKMGHEILTDEMSRFLTTVTIEVNKLQGDHDSEKKRLAATREKLEKEYASRYNPDPDPTDPFVTYEPPNLKLKEKAGHLFTKGNKSGQNKGWERSYFFTHSGSLKSQQATEDAEDVLRLDGAVASLCDVDDRRYVFQVVSKSQPKPVYLQAENQKTCEEWIAAIHNIAAELHELAVTTQMLSQPIGNQTGVVREERMRIKNWVDEQTKEAQQQQQRTSQKKESNREAMMQPPFSFLQTEATAQEGTGRVNPFNSTPATDGKVQFSQVYTVRFLGSTEVQKSKGVSVVYDTMRRVMQARAVHGVFKMVESMMVITTGGIKLMEPTTHEVKTDFRMRDVSFCASHTENQRLLGFITRSSAKHACHIFECDKSAKEICDSISCAMQIAYEQYVQRQGHVHQTREGQQHQQEAAQQHTRQSMGKKGKDKKAALQSFHQQPMGRHGQIDAIAAQNSWSNSPHGSIKSDRRVNAIHQAGDLQQVQGSSSAGVGDSPPKSEPLIQLGEQQPMSSNIQGGGRQPPGDSLGMFNPFFQDNQSGAQFTNPTAAFATRPTRAASNTLEIDPLLVPTSTPVDQSILTSGESSGFDMDLVAALNQASFGSPRSRFNTDSPSTTTPPQETCQDAFNSMSGLSQKVRFGETVGSSETSSASTTSSSSHAMSPALQFTVDSLARPATSLPSDMLSSAVNAAMQVAQATAEVSFQNVQLGQGNTEAPPPGDMKQGDSVSSLLSDLSE